MSNLTKRLAPLFYWRDIKMFDRLIECEADRGQIKDRSRYFFASSLMVGAVCFSAALISLYAAEIGLPDDVALVELIPPPALTADVPEPPKPHQERNSPAPAAGPAKPASRTVNMQRPDEASPIIPQGVSTVKNSFLARPIGSFIVGRSDSAGTSPSGTGKIGSGTTGSGTAENGEPTGSSTAVADLPKPPPLELRPAPRPVVSLGVITGKATNLPKPVYPAPAIAVNAKGDVQVQVSIDETGRVTSARAITGHPLLKAVSEQAAMKATFSPTVLSKVPVKVIGVIVYKFAK